MTVRNWHKTLFIKPGNTKNLVLMRILKDSMSPTIQEDDTELINTQ